MGRTSGTPTSLGRAVRASTRASEAAGIHSATAVERCSRARVVRPGPGSAIGN